MVLKQTTYLFPTLQDLLLGQLLFQEHLVLVDHLDLLDLLDLLERGELQVLLEPQAHQDHQDIAVTTEQ